MSLKSAVPDSTSLHCPFIFTIVTSVSFWTSVPPFEVSKLTRVNSGPWPLAVSYAEEGIRVITNCFVFLRQFSFANLILFYNFRAGTSKVLKFGPWFCFLPLQLQVLSFMSEPYVTLSCSISACTANSYSLVLQQPGCSAFTFVFKVRMYFTASLAGCSVWVYGVVLLFDAVPLLQWFLLVAVLCCGCWWYGWNFPAVFCDILLLCDSSGAKWHLTWKCVWIKDASLDSSMWKIWPLYQIVSSCSSYLLFPWK